MTPTGRFRRGDEPSMQNIPVRTEMGKAIRDAFVGHVEREGAIVGVALNRAARGEPLRIDITTPGWDGIWADKLIGPGRTVAEERAKVVAYLHGLADTRERVAAGMPNRDPHDVAVSAFRAAATTIENGEHWQS